MKNKMLSRLVERLIAIQPEELMVPILLLLVCALPIAAFFGVFGLLDAGTFLQVLVLATTLLATLAILHNVLYQRFREPDAEFAVRRLPHPLEDSLDDMHATRESSFAGPWLSRYDSMEQGMSLDDYAPDLLDDMLRSRGQGRLYYYQGL